MTSVNRSVPLYYYNNRNRKYAGANASTLISVLIGATSSKDVKGQLKKIERIAGMSEAHAPDIISDLSLISSNASLYKYILKSFPQYIISTLPVYQCDIRNKKIDHNNLLDIVLEQIEAGVRLITIHPTANKELMTLARERKVPWTSRGGSIIMADLVERNFDVDNAYLRIIDEIINAAKSTNTAISLGATFRSANIFDSLDQCQLGEFKMQKYIADYINDRGVSVIIEGPGHTPPNKIALVSAHYKAMGYPIMPLGPIPTDIAIGQDHISSAIGATLLGIEGSADILAAVTREEHTGKVPTIESTLEALVSTKIAAHIIDLSKLGDFTADRVIADGRANNNTCIFGKKNAGCSRCSTVCPLKFHY